MDNENNLQSEIERARYDEILDKLSELQDFEQQKNSKKREVILTIIAILGLMLLFSKYFFIGAGLCVFSLIIVLKDKYSKKE